jgi:selenocysteine-specific elongation factor
MLVAENYYRAVTHFNAHVKNLAGSHTGLKNQMRVRIHLLTIEVIGRIIIVDQKEILPGGEGFIQVRLEKEIYASFQDRFIIRQFSPQITLGGGVVLDTHPPRFRKKHTRELLAQLTDLYNGTIPQRILASFSPLSIRALSLPQLQIGCGISENRLKKELNELEKNGKVKTLIQAKERFYCSREQLAIILENIRRELKKYHQRFPGRIGMQFTELSSNLKKLHSEELVKLAVDDGVASGGIQRHEDLLSLPDFSSRLSDKEQQILVEIESTYRNANYNPPSTAELADRLNIKESKLREYINILRERHVLVVVSDQYLYHQELFRKLISMIRKFFSKNKEMKVSDLKEISDTTRKHAIPLLTFLDDQGYTQREGDVRLAGPRLSDAS